MGHIMSALQMTVHNDDCERRASFCAHNHNMYFKTCVEVPSLSAKTDKLFVVYW
jgi:hypothetical protein